MAPRLLGVETEYAIGAGERGGQVDHDGVAMRLLEDARRLLPHLPDEVGMGVYLASGARLYVDAGSHPEMTTPECTNPWDVVRYIQAGERLLVRLLREQRGRRSGPVLLRSNVDYSGSRSTWGCHESYHHRADPAVLPAQVIPHLVSRIVFSGAGGFDNRAPGLVFLVSPRTSHLHFDVSNDSTGRRGIFHTKDESLSAAGHHRLHVLSGESLCSETSSWLKVGTTALVVAMVDAGLRPGDAVALGEPVHTIHRLAAEVDGVFFADALAIQRHYLEIAERHLGAPWMPPWAEEVCRVWADVLTGLAAGWQTLATTLDWTIKRALYGERLARRGFDWEAVAAWNRVADALASAMGRREQARRNLSAALVSDPASPIAGVVRALGAGLLAEQGLSWDDFPAFLAARSELFEIDTRFGQLGRAGLFTILDDAGVLAHRLDDLGDVEHATANPPPGSRATLRGRLVRELAPDARRYVCGWQSVRDVVGRRHIDLSDPFATEMPAWTADAAAPAGEEEAAGLLGRLGEIPRFLRRGGGPGPRTTGRVPSR
jgi:proteasome accessory factor A